MSARSVIRDSSAGFSLVELVVTLGLATSMSVIALGVLGTASSIVQGDADLRVVESQLKLARESAINQRRAMEMRFVAPNIIQVVRRNLPNGTEVISRAFLEHRAVFMTFTGLPDTPDLFGNATPVAFGPAAVMFTADGMLTDATGNPVNGTVFLGQPGRPLSARALTVFGATANVRTYRWNGTQWRR
jgi:Tfp pilus assembly protein FimT